MHGGRGHESVDGGREQRARPGRTGVARQTGVARLVAVFAVPALAITLLPGCTAEATTTPPTSPSVVTTPSPTPTPTPTPTPDASVKPERPAAMDEVNAAGAEAVAVYFLHLFPYVYATGDLEEWRELSHPECIFCADVIRGVEEALATGVHSEGGLVEVTDVTSTETTLGRWFLVSFSLAEAPSAELDSNGGLVSQSAGKDYHIDVAVIREDDAWSIRELTHTRVD